MQSEMPGDADSAEINSGTADSEPNGPEEDADLLHQMELKQSLRELCIVANSSTARLDNTYYSVLEKFSTLQHSVAALQELCSTARRLNDDFVHNSENVTKEVQEQLETLEDLAAQQASIESLQSRIMVGRKRVSKLSERVDVVRQRAEAWSKVEAQWEEKTSRRIKLFWGLSAAILLILLGLLVFQYTPTRQVAGLGKNFNVPGVGAGIRNNETLASTNKERSALDEFRRVPDAALEDDPRLRIFDEL